MLDFFPDNTLLKLTEVAKELNCTPEMALIRIGIESCQVLKIRVRNCTKFSKKYFLFDERDVCTLPDEKIIEAYIPANENTINDIREYGKYTTSRHEVMIPSEEGYMTDMYVPEEGLKIEATIETLWLRASHANILRQIIKSEKAGIQDDSQLMPSDQEQAVEGRDEIMAALGCKSWNTCKRWMRKYSITGPPWRLPWSISVKINAERKK